jgi:hypothetical protein
MHTDKSDKSRIKQINIKKYLLKSVCIGGKNDLYLLCVYNQIVIRLLS